MKKIIDSIKYIKFKDLLSPFIFIFVLPISIFFKIYNCLKKRSILLITEDGKTARDNGYHFFKYVREKHPNDYCYFVIDKNSNDYNKVKKFGHIIQYGSLKHWIYYLSAKYNISNHKNGNPSATFFYVLHVIFKLYNNRVFLQHGITINNGIWLYYKNTKFRYFICGAKEEYEYIKEKFGYPNDNLVYTGFARFDNLNSNKTKKNQILIMPTWRNWLGRETNSLGEKYIFTNTSYYLNWNKLLNNDKFIKYIEKNNINVLFYPHINMQKFLNSFETKSKNIKMVSSKTDIQKVLKESSIMITDYSSVFMDFAYMLKPILFYQFDYNEFRKKQYSEGYYNYKDGFGPSTENCNELVENFIKIYENGIQKKYEDRMKKFFEYRDTKNCERIYNILIKGL